MIVAVSVSQASGSKFKPNKHGLMPVVLSPLNGVLPENSGILDGSIAQRMGLASGGQYVVNVEYRGTEEYNGKQYKNYSYTLVTKLGAGFENMVAQQVVQSMNFGFTPTVPTNHVEATTPTPEETPTPVE